MLDACTLCGDGGDQKRTATVIQWLVLVIQWLVLEGESMTSGEVKNVQ